MNDERWHNFNFLINYRFTYTYTHINIYIHTILLYIYIVVFKYATCKGCFSKRNVAYNFIHYNLYFIIGKMPIKKKFDINKMHYFTEYLCVLCITHS